MNLDMLYPWLKALHVVAALLFAAGLMATTLFLWSTRDGSRKWQPMTQAIRHWDRTVTVPALLAVWILGLCLASSGHWLGQSWLNAKFVLVVVLSGLHGIQSGKLRRKSEGLDPMPAKATIPLLLACICSIAILAVVKPH